MVEFSIAEKNFSVTRPKLRKWIAVENHRNTVEEGVDRKDDSRFISGIYSFLSTLVSITEEELKSAPWYEVVEGYYLSSLENSLRLDLSIARTKPRQRQELPDAWEYDERTWYAWAHLFAEHYHWNIEYIAELDVDDAMALLQEISLQEQFDREWQYGLSEVAYEYDKSSKVSRLKPLTRPSWMSKATQSVKETIEKQATKVVKTPRSFVPPGLVILDGQQINTNELAGGTNPPPNTP